MAKRVCSLESYGIGLAPVRLPLPDLLQKLHPIHAGEAENLILPTGNLCDLFPALNAMAQAHPLILIGISAATLLGAIGCSSEGAKETEPVAETAAPDSGSLPEPPPGNVPQTLQPTNGLQLVQEEQLFKTNGLWYLRGTTNLFSGMELDFHTNGVPRFQMYFTNGLSQGLNTSWHPNGAKQSEGKFVDGKREGLWHMWLDNGKPDKQGMFVNGKPDGLQIFWYTNGVKSVEWYHREGIPHGNSRSYYMNGELHQEGTYDMGRQIGVWIEWDESGKKTKTAQFENGQLIKETNLTEPAALTPPQK